MLTPAEALADDGPLARLIDGFRARREQQEMAAAVAAALKDGYALVCEAGTGTGKTFSYLVPALMSGQRVVVSTGTRHLQDQLFQRDLPMVKKALGQPVEIALLKGRANYLCRYRLDQARASGQGPQARLQQLSEWARVTTHGDLTEYPDISDDDSLWPLVTSTTDNCLGQDCPDFDECFVLRARRGAVQSEIVVVNHHLLLADMTLRETGFAELLPAVDAIIFDEAHQLPALAADFFSDGLNSRQLLGLARDSRSALREEAADMPDLEQRISDLETGVQHLRLVFGSGDIRQPWDRWARHDRIEAVLDELDQALNVLSKDLEEITERGRLLTAAQHRCTVQIQRLRGFREENSSSWVRWVETQGQAVQLHRTPIDVSSAFQSRLQAYGCTPVYTSATLAVKNDFSHFAGQLGLQGADKQSWPGPFDYSQQALLYMPSGLPEPMEPGYTQRLIESVRPVLQASDGRAFILFTSHRALKEAARALENYSDHPLLVQGDIPRTELLHRFREHGNAVLLGTSSFWEGVDVRGEALTCVIIDKLPFPPPDDPVYAARAARMKEEGIEPFMNYALPQAILNLKQGIGRLLRDIDDYGVLVLGDPRLTTRGYGKKIMSALPPIPLTHDIEDVKRFYRERREKGSEK
ncbi:MAG: ATP-dependent DNA helicase [Gammaproteobacteria bacterium]|nr:ATP-dependent DNA helicase [Gammaproteobacteria bacterium]